MKQDRSQSSVSYHIARLQDLLGIEVFRIVGRKARLTVHGEVLYRRSQQLLREAEQLVQLAHTLEQGWEPEISLVVDAAFPIGLLMQVIIRDSGYARKMDFSWLQASHQWSVSSIDTAVTAISNGLGFGWLPRHAISSHIDKKNLKTLPLTEGQQYRASLQMIYGDSESAGSATRTLAEIIKDVVISNSQA
jgi:DNA-binding transcriptional LysR family regulator